MQSTAYNRLQSPMKSIITINTISEKDNLIVNNVLNTATVHKKVKLKSALKNV